MIYNSKVAKLYNLDQILRENMEQVYKMGDVIGEGNVVGQAPFGFPVNVFIKQEPEVLFHVGCHDYDVGFSSFWPFMCLTTSKDDCYKVSFMFFS